MKPHSQQLIIITIIPALIQMHNHNHPLNYPEIPSFYYIPNALQYYTLLPITPSLSETSTPHPDQSLNMNSLMFPSQVDQQFYYASNPHLTQAMQQSPAVQQGRASESCPSMQTLQHSSIQSCFSLNGTQRTEKDERISLARIESAQLCIERSAIKQNQRAKHTRNNKTEQIQDREYLPQLQRKKKGTSKYQQNENRNIVPNEINQIFSFIQKPAKSAALLNRALQRYPHPQHYTAKRYYQYQSLLKNKLGHYTNEKSLKLVTQLYEPKCESWSEHEQRYYNKLSRVLIRHFLYEDSIFIILTSKRMRREKKSDHLRARRQIGSMVLSILEGW